MEGKKNPQKTRSSGSQETIHMTRRQSLCLGSADEALRGKKQGQVASFQTFLIILRANSHQEPRGEWLQVTKDLHSEGQNELLLTPGCRLGGGGVGRENDRIQGWPA